MVLTAYSVGRPEEKFTNDADGIAAFVEHQTDEVFKSTAYLTDAFQLTIKEKKRHIPLSVAYNTPNNLFGWHEQPENALKWLRFSAAMRNVLKDDAPDAVTNGNRAYSCLPVYLRLRIFSKGFPWGDLKENSKVVDVGGRVGHMGMEILKEHPHLHIVVQDQPSVMDQALQVCCHKCTAKILRADKISNHSTFLDGF
jgi:hypothetical protein